MYMLIIDINACKQHCYMLLSTHRPVLASRLEQIVYGTKHDSLVPANDNSSNKVMLRLCIGIAAQDQILQLHLLLADMSSHII